MLVNVCGVHEWRKCVYNEKCVFVSVCCVREWRKCVCNENEWLSVIVVFVNDVNMFIKMLIAVCVVCEWWKMRL